MTVKTVKAVIALMRELDIDSIWEYKSDDNKQTLWACYRKGEYGVLDIGNKGCSALKHYGEITEMGEDFLKMHTGENKVDEIEYPVSPETKEWWMLHYPKRYLNE